MPHCAPLPFSRMLFQIKLSQTSRIQQLLSRSSLCFHLVSFTDLGIVIFGLKINFKDVVNSQLLVMDLASSLPFLSVLDIRNQLPSSDQKFCLLSIKVSYSRWPCLFEEVKAAHERNHAAWQLELHHTWHVT